jgi:aspartyl-tRNA(Asn)/glutamyl-tRNA(Gln) amidotransferase subunit A
MKHWQQWPETLSNSEKQVRWQETVRRSEQAVGAFLQFDPALGRSQSAAKGPLAGIPFAVKDNIAVKDFRLTCASRLLEDLVSPYTATAVEKLQQAGAVMVGKTNLDEFGMGSSCENSALAVTSNPWDSSLVPGGSSGGSAAAVAAGMVPFALGSDTGGSVRQPASFCGVYGLKPTYGAVSRFGLVAYASSLETIGVIAGTVSRTRDVFACMRGQDPLDHSSLAYRPAAARNKEISVGIPALKPGSGQEKGALHPDVAASLEKTRQALKTLGFEIREITLPSLDRVVSSYYVIAMAEASANLARFDGVRYGRRAMDADAADAADAAETPEELMRLSRSRGLGGEVKLRILLGTYVLRSGFQDRYYLRAQKIRSALRHDFQQAFGQVDLILLPTYPYPPFEKGGRALDPFAQKLADIYTCSANLAGLPAMSFPASLENGLPVGMQFMAPAFAEELLFRACERFEEHFPAPACPLAVAAGGG